MSYHPATVTYVANAAIPTRRVVQGATVGAVRRVIESVDGTIVTDEDIKGILDTGEEATAAGDLVSVVVQGLVTGQAGAAGIAIDAKYLTTDTASGDGRLVEAALADQIVAINCDTRAVAANEEVQVCVMMSNDRIV